MTKNNESLEALFALADDVFGPVDDLSSIEVRDFLADAQCDTTELKRRLYEKATALRGAFWSRSADAPNHLTDFIQQLRPVDVPTSDPDLQRSSANKWLHHLLNRRPAFDDSTVVYAFRDRDDEVTEGDADLLKQLADRLKNRAKRENK
jgi:hypothetical protein